MSNLIFKSSHDALDYIEKYYTKPCTLKPHNVFFGRIDSVEQSEDGQILFVVEFLLSKGWLVKKIHRQTGFGKQDPSLDQVLEESDLILWEALSIDTQIPIGSIIKRLSLEWDVKTQNFLPHIDTATRSREQDSEALRLASLMRLGDQIANSGIDNQFGRILLESEIFESQDAIFIVYKNNGMRKIIGWDSSRSTWILNTSSIEIFGFIASSPQKLNQLIFCSNSRINERRKQNLVDALLVGLGEGYKKCLEVETTMGKVKFWFSFAEWNAIVIGEAFKSTLKGQWKVPDRKNSPYSTFDESYIANTEFTLTINWDGTPDTYSEEDRQYGRVYVWYEDPDDSWISMEVFDGMLKQINGYYWDAKKDENNLS